MGILDIFLKERANKTVSKIKIGDWVTQYSAGYWKIVNIFPKYADADYSYEGTSWKKGDRLGDWAVLEKGFTAKMKPSNGCEFVDAQWCNPVSADVMRSIEQAFTDHPKAREKFENAPDMPRPSIASIWMNLSEEQAESFRKLLVGLPDRFTKEKFWTLAAEYRPYEVDPSRATHILYLFSYLWEMDDQFEPLHFGPKLKRK